MTESSNYTLPGVMKYLQEQFSLAERNRLQGDLERSTLKLQLIQLEHERNSLLRENDRLKSKLEELGHVEHKDQVEDQDQDDLEDETLANFKSTDASKLIKARQFLSTATNEIIYLLKSPLLDFEALSLDQDDPFFKISQSQSQSSSSSAGYEKDLNNTEQFKSNDDQSDQETIIEEIDENHNNRIQQKKLFNLLKRNQEPKFTDLEIKLDGIVDLELKSGILFVYYAELNVVKVYNEKGKDLICEITLPEKELLVDVITNEKYILLATKSTISIYPVENNSKPIVWNDFDNFKIEAVDMDASQGKIVLIGKEEILILQINDDLKINKLKSFKYSLAGTGNGNDDQLLKIKILTHHPTSDLVLLTNSSLVFFDLDSGKDVSNVQMMPFKNWTMNGLSLIANFEHGIYLFDFADLNEFQPVPVSLDDKDNLFLGSCADNDSYFYVANDKFMQVFESTSVGIRELMKLENVDGGCIGFINENVGVVNVQKGNVGFWSL